MYKALSILLILFTVIACNKNKDKTQNKTDKQLAAIQSGDAIKSYELIYPEVKKVDTVDEYWGTQVADPYRWLEDEDATDVFDWVQAQNEVSYEYLGRLPHQKKLHERLTALYDYPKVSTPRKEGENIFFSRNDGLQNQSIVYKQKGLSGEAEVFIDPNKFASDGTSALSGMYMSPDDKLVVYGKAVAGSDWQELFVKDVESGKDREDHIEFVKFSGAAWYQDGFFYARFPEPEEGEALSSLNQDKQLYYHKLGTFQTEDKLVYENKEHPLRGFYPITSDDGQYLIITETEGATSNNALLFKDLTKKRGEVEYIIDNFDNDYAYIDTYDDKLLIMTDKDAPRKKVMLINPAKAKEKRWKEIIPQREEVLQWVQFVGGKLFAVYMKDATHRVHVYSPEGDYLYELELPGPGTINGFSGGKDDTFTFYSFNSFLSPGIIYKYDIASNKSEVFRESEIDFDFSKYETNQVFFKSKDGTRIPMFITHQKSLEFNGDNPTLLYGYGGFNINILPSFRISTLALLEAGGVYAQAVLRGGGEYGEEWHKAGMLDNKQKVFDDFISAAEYLIEQGYTSKDKIAIEGRSNGGLLVGACMAQRPELFKVALPAVGVMDMLRYHKFTIGHAWVVEYGSSERTKAEFENLYGYSPLHNLKAGTSYPATLVTTADHDDRVVPAHSFKFISELQSKHKGAQPVLIRIETKAGHGSGKSTTKAIEERADILAFLFYHLGIQ